ncbi:hypothetical protein ONZ45_g15269 [Pleurotus djamor]|nr:hypothetical protein ONZ45_g15269 [Pleurotus djamor]
MSFIPVVDVERYLKLAVPSVAEETNQVVINKLKERGSITKDGLILGFDTTTQTDHFRPFHEFISNVSDVAAEVFRSQPMIASCYTPDKTSESDEPDEAHPSLLWTRTPTFVAGSSEEPDGFEDQVVAIILKGDHTLDDFASNVDQIMWSAQQTLFHDLRRMFFYGITAEHHTSRLWFFARSHIMVTVPFDFTINPAHLVKLFVGLAFCHILEKSKRDLSCPYHSGLPPRPKQAPLETHGYNSSIHRHEGFSSIRLNNEWYNAFEVMTHYWDSGILGRCTRVFTATRFGDSMQTLYYLKDTWIERTHSTEGELWTQLMDRLVDNPDVDQEVVDNHFVRLVDCESVRRPATTCHFLRRGELSAQASVEAFKQDRRGFLDIQSLLWGIWGSRAPPSYTHHVNIGLHPWSIIICDGKARLADFDFVSFYDPKTAVRADDSVGKPEFMALEVKASGYLSEPFDCPVPVAPIEEVYLFLHNPLHDLESVCQAERLGANLGRYLKRQYMAVEKTIPIPADAFDLDVFTTFIDTLVDMRQLFIDAGVDKVVKGVGGRGFELTKVGTPYVALSEAT